MKIIDKIRPTPKKPRKEYYRHQMNIEITPDAIPTYLWLNKAWKEKGLGSRAEFVRKLLIAVYEESAGSEKVTR